jgi:hypothetical protein
MKISEKWQENWFFPVLVNLTTGLIVFLVLTIFTPVGNWLFPPDVVEGYPLICRADPYPGDSAGVLNVDFFIVNANQDNEGFKYAKLQKFISDNHPDPDNTSNPDIILPLRDAGGSKRILAAYPDSSFNGNKGSLDVKITDDAKSVRIRVNEIKANAILKVVMQVSGVMGSNIITRDSYPNVPFHFGTLHSQCYTP